MDIQYCVMETTTTVLIARKRGLRRVAAGLADILTLQPEALVPPDRESKVVIVEQRLSRRDVERMLAAFDLSG